MENINIEATRFTPGISFDSKSNLFKIRGESYPENTADFYSPVFFWIENYIEQLENQSFTIDIELFYFNSSSSKILLDLFDLLEAAAKKGKHITVNWIYEDDDEESLEFGEEFQEDFNAVHFNLIRKDVSGEQKNSF